MAYIDSFYIWDSKTEKVLNTLQPVARKAAASFIYDCYKQGMKVRAYLGTRTFDEQNALYAKGRTAPGNKVTNAKGGQSFHNYGLAFDCVEIKNSKALWNNSNWAKIGQIGINNGFEWGGNFKSFKDKPHFQMTFGLTWQQLLNYYNQGIKDISQIVETNKKKSVGN